MKKLGSRILAVLIMFTVAVGAIPTDALAYEDHGAGILSDDAVLSEDTQDDQADIGKPLNELTLPEVLNEAGKGLSDDNVGVTEETSSDSPDTWADGCTIKVNTPHMTSGKLLSVDWTTTGVESLDNQYRSITHYVFVCKGTTDQVFDDAAIWSIESEAQRSRSYWTMASIRSNYKGTGLYEPAERYIDTDRGSYYGLMDWDAYNGEAEPSLKNGDTCSLQVVIGARGSVTGGFKNLFLVSDVVTFKIDDTFNPQIDIKSARLNPQGRAEVLWNMEGFPEEDEDFYYRAKVVFAKGDHTDSAMYNRYDNGWWEDGIGDWNDPYPYNSRGVLRSEEGCNYVITDKMGAYTGTPVWGYGSSEFENPDPLTAGDDVTLSLRVYRVEKEYEEIADLSTRCVMLCERKQVFKVSDYSSDQGLILDIPRVTANGKISTSIAITGDAPKNGYNWDKDDPKFYAYVIYVIKGGKDKFDWDKTGSEGQNWRVRFYEGSNPVSNPSGFTIYDDTPSSMDWRGGKDTLPGLRPGDVLTYGVAIEVNKGTYYSDKPIDTLYRSDPVSFTVAGGNIKQPSVSPDVLKYDKAEGAENHTDKSFNRSDGSFRFTYSLLYEDKALREGTDYISSGNRITLKKAFLSTLPEGNNMITLHYGDEVEGVEPVDPVLTVSVSDSYAASVAVKDKDGNDVTENCSIGWKSGNSSAGSGAVVVTDEAKDLTCVITPQDSLKMNGIQYYTQTTVSIQTKKGGNKVTVNLAQQGKLQLVVRAEGAELSKSENGGYSVTWYTKDADLAKKYTSSDPDAEGFYNIGAGSGDKSESPMAPKGTMLFYDVNMYGNNATAYRDIIKASVAAGYGISTVVADATKGENIVLNISGNKRSGEPLSPDDYTIKWYRKTADGAYEQLKHGRDFVEGNILYERDTEIGKTYYYEIMPKDSEGVHNWFEFHGVRAAEASDDDPGTAVVPNGKPQSIDVSLGTVEPMTIKGRISNSDDVIATSGVEALSFSLTQAVWDGYAGSASGYDQSWYYDSWNKIPFTIDTDSEGITFEAVANDLDTMIRIEDSKGNFETAHKSIRQKDIGETAEVTMIKAQIPDYLYLNIYRQSAEDNDDGYVRKQSYWGDEFGDRLEYVLTNVTTGTVIDPAAYRIDRYYLKFTDMDYARANISIGDSLKLDAKLKERRIIATTPEGEALEDDPGLSIEVGSDTMTVARYSRDNEKFRFDLVYSEYGRMLFTTTTNRNNKTGRINEAWAIYDEAGNLTESKTKYYSSDKAISQIMPAGNYTLMVWRSGKGYNAASTLTEALATIEKSSCQLKEFNVTDGHMTRLDLGSSPFFTLKTIFVWDETGFKDELVQASLNEYKLFTIPYKVDPAVVSDNPAGTKYQFTVRKAHSNSWNDPGFYNIELKCRNGYKYGVAEADKNIVVYDKNGKIAKSEVTIDIIDGLHLASVKGFTLETSEPEGKICFYLKCATGGDHPVTVSGKIKGEDKPAYSIGEINVRVDESGSISFASDYLHTGINTMWTYTVPTKKVQLYMDDVKIDERASNSSGAASFSFTADDAFKAKFADKEGWHLYGPHDLYTITDPDGANIRSEVSTLTYADAGGYMPAVLSEIWVRTGSDYEKDQSSGRWDIIFRNDRTGVNLRTQYWSPDERGRFFTYDFSVKFDNADLIETDPETGSQASVYMWVTGQDDKEYPVLLKRKAGTNEFEGSITEEGLLFASWGINFKSKKPVRETIWIDDIKTSDLKVSEDGTTAAQMYAKLMSTETDPDDPMVGCYGSMTEEELDEVLDIACESIQDFFTESGIIPKDSDLILDGSDESMRRLNELLGIREGTAVGDDKLFDYEGWAGWKDIPVNEVKNPDGTTRSLAWVDMTYEDGYFWLEDYYVELPVDADDKGYEMLQVTRLNEAEIGEAAGAEVDEDMIGVLTEGELPENLMADGHAHDQFAQFNAKTLTKMKNFNRALTRSVERVNGYPARTSYQLVFLKNNLENALNISGKSMLSQETAAISQMRSLVRELQNAAKDKKFGAVSSVYEKRFNEYQNRLTKAELFRDIGAGKTILTEIKTVYATVKTARAMLKVKSLSEVGEFLSENTIISDLKEMKDLGAALLKMDWKKLAMGVGGLALDQMLDQLENALDEKIEKSQQDVIDIMNEIQEDLAIRGLMKPMEEEKPQGQHPQQPQTPGGGTSGSINVSYRYSTISSHSNYNSYRRPSGGRSAAIHDPQGVVYEAVLSNPVVSATATLNEKTSGGEATWNAEDYGQENPQTTGADGMYQWFVPEGEYKVYVTAPDGSGLLDNDSSQHPAANKDDGSTAGWLPVLPVQMGINIPLYSSASPKISSVYLYKTHAVVNFSLYMDISTLSSDVVGIYNGEQKTECTIEFPDEEESPLGDGRYYARTMILVPVSGGGFADDSEYVVRIGQDAQAYNHKSLEAAYTSNKLKSIEKPASIDVTDPESGVVNISKGEETTITVTLKDEKGNPISGTKVFAAGRSSGVVSVTPTDDVTSKNGTVSFTVNGVADGNDDIVFTTEDAAAACTLYVNVGKVYTYKYHNVTWSRYNKESGRVSASLLVTYEVQQGETVTMEEIPSGPLNAVPGDIRGSYRKYSIAYKTRDPKIIIHADQSFDINTGDALSDDYDYNGVEDGKILVGFEEADVLKGLIYTGMKLTPRVRVTNGTRILIEGVDYSVSYKKNINAGKAIVVVTSKVKPRFKETLEFEILPVNLASTEVMVTNNVTAIGKKASPVLIYKGQVLKLKKDYTGLPSEKLAKDTLVTVSGGNGGNFTGAKTFTVYVKDKKNLRSLSVKLKNAEFVYNGSPRIPTIASPSDSIDKMLTVTDKKSKAILTEGTDYVVSCSANVEAGTVKIIIAGKGDVTGTVRKSFKIRPAVWTKKKTAGVKSFTVTNSDFLDAGVAVDKSGVKPVVMLQAVLDDTDGTKKELIPGIDYRISYSRNKKAGKGIARISFLGNFKGSKMDTIEFLIK